MSTLHFSLPELVRAAQQTYIKRGKPEFNHIAHLLCLEPDGTVVYTDGFILLIHPNSVSIEGQGYGTGRDEQILLDLRTDAIPGKGPMTWTDGVLDAGGKLIRLPEWEIEQDRKYPDYQRIIPTEEVDENADEGNLGVFTVFYALAELYKSNLVSGDTKSGGGTWLKMGMLYRHKPLHDNGLDFYAAPLRD